MSPSDVRNSIYSYATAEQFSGSYATRCALGSLSATSTVAKSLYCDCSSAFEPHPLFSLSDSFRLPLCWLFILPIKSWVRRWRCSEEGLVCLGKEYQNSHAMKTWKAGMRLLKTWFSSHMVTSTVTLFRTIVTWDPWISTCRGCWVVKLRSEDWNWTKD